VAARQNLRALLPSSAVFLPRVCRRSTINDVIVLPRFCRLSAAVDRQNVFFVLFLFLRRRGNSLQATTG